MSLWDIGTPLDVIYKTFFDRAEAHRRWRLDRDIDWEAQAPEVPADFVEMAETFWAVESFLPDYTSEVARAFRTDRARVWAHTMWSYEESKHGRALEEWLIRGGHRTADDLNRLSATMWGAGGYAMPDHYNDRSLLAYQALQEGMTRLVYTQFRRQAEAVGDGALVDVLRHLASDEQAHALFFRACLAEFLREDPEGTTADIYSVLTSFTMPVGRFIPDYPARSRTLSEQGISSPVLFITKVWIPMAQAVGIDPVPPPLRGLVAAGYSLDDLVGMLSAHGGNLAWVGDQLREGVPVGPGSSPAPSVVA